MLEGCNIGYDERKGASSDALKRTLRQSRGAPDGRIRAWQTPRVTEDPSLEARRHGDMPRAADGARRAWEQIHVFRDTDWAHHDQFE